MKQWTVKIIDGLFRVQPQQCSRNWIKPDDEERNCTASNGATEFAGQENAGLENDGQKCRAGICRTGKWRTKVQGWKMQSRKLTALPPGRYNTSSKTVEPVKIGIALVSSKSNYVGVMLTTVSWQQKDNAASTLLAQSNTNSWSARHQDSGIQ